MRLTAACALAGGRSARSSIDRRFQRVLAVTSQNFTALVVASGGNVEMGRIGQLLEAAAALPGSAT